MPAIWKATIDKGGVHDIKMPKGAKILCAKEQHDMIAIWYSCDPNAPMETRKIAIQITGSTIPSNAQYIDTILLANGHFVVHVYEYLSDAALIAEILRNT